MSEPQITEIEDKYYSVKDVAQIFQVTEYTVRVWINETDDKKFKLAAMKFGKSWRISKGALVDLANRMYHS